MVGSAEIGAVRVGLSLNSTQFTTGLDGAQSKLKSFGKIARLSLAGLGVAAAGAATAMGVGIKHALDHADALGKSAQKAGVAVEALSRLEYAAKLSDISLEQLTGGLQKLNKSMVDVASGKGPAAAFNALDIAVTDSAGNLRSSDAVFADFADRFSRIEDGALKTHIAMDVFGKSGAELIPLLNEGRDGLAAMAAESDRVGFTLSGTTTAGSEKFNDIITAMQMSLQGVFNRIIGDQGVMTALQSLAGTLSSPEFAAAMTTFANGVISSINFIAKAATGAMQAVTQLEQWAKQSAAFWNDVRGTTVDKNAGARNILDSPANMILPDPVGIVGKEIPQSQWPDILGGNNVPRFIPPAVNRPGLSMPSIDPFTPLTTGAQTATEAAETFKDAFAGIAPLLETVRDPFAQWQSDLDALSGWLNKNPDEWATYASAVQKATAGMVASFADLAGSALAAFGQIFKGNKAIAVASAIVNGIGSVAKTLETYGVTPWGLAAAGIAATTAAANVASILSTSENSTSMPGTGASGGGAVAAAGPAQQSATTVILRGSSFNAEDIAGMLSNLMRDGGGQSLINVIREV